jgi:cytochrome bd-type quinol oxidase subunit 1
MPLLMAIAEWRYLKTGDEVYYTLARRWAAGTAIMFAVGAASGTVLSFELGHLWARFIKWLVESSACPSPSKRALRFFCRPCRPNKSPFYTE